ncbi:hypothetical protein R4P64_29615 [Rhodococcus sp. IEGM 1366]|uniref:hypothetical protein n=1 Tax=Rhodococcus sp. IEGM 1366 TaxID=3082223 RepID=UPI002955CC50|nr:hypothetical protein [Rhodococcus sp. IEGM 1366]MDV8070695.1 hypothetical protein [Rhodococcus sp. IEGM 1366]
MTMLAEEYDFVIGGDLDRDIIELAILDTVAGVVRTHLARSADGARYIPYWFGNVDMRPVA